MLRWGGGVLHSFEGIGRVDVWSDRAPGVWPLHNPEKQGGQYETAVGSRRLDSASGVGGSESGCDDVGYRRFHRGDCAEMGGHALLDLEYGNDPGVTLLDFWH